ncbi:MAG TPA: WYL domain-containing protein [Gemmatimonadaceae bacterium]
MSASRQFSRIVSLVAELSRAARHGDDAPTLAELARRHGVSERDINADIRALTLLGDRSSDADWLLSLRIWQQEDRVSIVSEGPFRRPVRLSPEEQLAVQLALALDPEGTALAQRLSALWKGAGTAPHSPGDERPESTADVVRRAARERIALEVQYAGEVRREVTTRTIHPHQVVESGVRTYVVAWAEDVGAWRHFRLDRILDAKTTGRTFETREDFEPLEQPRDAFRPRGTTERVSVRFRPEAAEWVSEFFEGHERQDDGSIMVHFDASSPEWLVRRVLEFGSDAEVVSPGAYRAAVARAVA